MVCAIITANRRFEGQLFEQIAHGKLEVDVETRQPMSYFQCHFQQNK